MAYNQAPAFVLVALVLLAAANPMVRGQVILSGGSVTGILCCALNGNCPGGPPVSGASVSLICTNLLGTNVTLGSGTTGVNGGFNITVSNLISTIGSIIPGGKLPCTVVVQLPLSQTVCPILSTVQGILAGVPTLVSTVLSPVQGVLGELAVAVFVNVKL